MFNNIVNQKINQLIDKVPKPSKINVILGSKKFSNAIGKYTLIFSLLSLPLSYLFCHKIKLDYFFAILLAGNIAFKPLKWNQNKVLAYSQKIKEINQDWLVRIKDDKEIILVIQKLELIKKLYSLTQKIEEKRFDYHEMLQLKNEIESNLDNNNESGWDWIYYLKDDFNPDNKIIQWIKEHENWSLEQLTDEIKKAKKMYYHEALKHFSNETKALALEKDNSLFIGHEKKLAL
jgi:hypothetical protein